MHIRRNSNGNQGNAALVDFATLRDKENATKYMIFYQNARLRWDALSYIENKNYEVNSKKETEGRREINRRKRNLSEMSETSRISRTSREEQRVDNNYNIKKRKFKDYRAIEDIHKLRKQIQDIEYQIDMRNQSLFDNRQHNAVWHS